MFYVTPLSYDKINDTPWQCQNYIMFWYGVLTYFHVFAVSTKKNNFSLQLPIFFS